MYIWSFSARTLRLLIPLSSLYLSLFSSSFYCRMIWICARETGVGVSCCITPSTSLKPAKRVCLSWLVLSDGWYGMVIFFLSGLLSICLLFHVLWLIESLCTVFCFAVTYSLSFSFLTIIIYLATLNVSLCLHSFSSFLEMGISSLSSSLSSYKLSLVSHTYIHT